MNVCYIFSISQIPAMVLNKSVYPIEVYWLLQDPREIAYNTRRPIDKVLNKYNMKFDIIPPEGSSKYFDLPSTGGYVSIRPQGKEHFFHFDISPSKFLVYESSRKYQYM